jgi:hypothetical protein
MVQREEGWRTDLTGWQWLSMNFARGQRKIDRTMDDFFGRRFWWLSTWTRNNHELVTVPVDLYEQNGRHPGEGRAAKSRED